MFRTSILFLCILCAFTACTRLPNIQGKGSAIFQGIWNQDSVENESKLLNYTQHKFKITCDSFYVDLTTHSKVNYYSDSCFNNGVWKEYAKGVYAIRNDSLFLVGTFTKENYRQKISGCYQIGQYIKAFKILKTAAQKIVMESSDNQRIVTLVLKEQIICVPKSL
ncbi:fumarate hydratase [Pedobacter sp. JCM 36344]|uniref:fumarate hydratase n=1 Tax=Pedobacter sp. JCM 36344 TaxID=3374280 RepID=UPI00397BB59F